VRLRGDPLGGLVQDWSSGGLKARLLGRQAGFGRVAETRETGQGRAPGHSRAPYPPEECPVTIRWGRAINRTTLAGSRQPIIVNLDVSGDNARAQSVLLLFFLHPPSSSVAAQPPGTGPVCSPLGLAPSEFKDRLRLNCMNEAIIFQKFPIVQKAEPGTYWWCACGRSKGQPFCDGSHKGTELGPIKAEITEAKTVAWCGCKHSQHAPFCDGSHARL
jgi:CDGSH-type Zn-finger protein